MLTNAEFYVNYADYGILISKMLEKVTEARKRDKNRDFSEQYESIETLQRLQNLFHLMYHAQQTIENESGKVMMERKRLLDKIASLQKENESLKNEIQI